MLVERSKLRKLMAMEAAKVAVKNKDGNNVDNKAGNDVGNDITPSVGKPLSKSLEKKPTIPDEIFLDDDARKKVRKCDNCNEPKNDFRNMSQHKRLSHSGNKC